MYTEPRAARLLETIFRRGPVVVAVIPLGLPTFTRVNMKIEAEYSLEVESYLTHASILLDILHNVLFRITSHITHPSVFLNCRR